jgi:trans-aconitate 2-methyltransferase
MLQIPADLQPREIWDLGCGTGEHAALLALRHPGALVHGLDSSPEMLATAKARAGAVDWVLSDIAQFEPAHPPDLIFTNAALQWLPDHEALFKRLVGLLAPGGVFACQVPVTWDQSWHQKLRAIGAESPWSALISGVRDVQPIAAATAYHAWLSPLAELDIWTTTYVHALRGEDPVVAWMKGTGLRPYLARLPDPSTQAAFIARYREEMRHTFPQGADGVTLFPFPRLFIMARRR